MYAIWRRDESGAELKQASVGAAAWAFEPNPQARDHRRRGCARMAYLWPMADDAPCGGSGRYARPAVP
eukprot:5949231-Prymnesium_polylepis.1